MKTKVGDKIKITSLDKYSDATGVEIGHVGKVVEVYPAGCFAENPLWGKGSTGFFNSEFEVLNKSEGLNDD
ncbi:hypothetical protein Bestia_00158 [Acinetobacter phage Bestia]|nr:hypothetical protein Bestia_00158 [Acinetobacter phage Bestia]